MRPGLDPTLERIRDDLYLSYRITPDMTVVYDKTLRVGISTRPFSSLRGLGKDSAGPASTCGRTAAGVGAAAAGG